MKDELMKWTPIKQGLLEDSEKAYYDVLENYDAANRLYLETLAFNRKLKEKGIEDDTPEYTAWTYENLQFWSEQVQTVSADIKKMYEEKASAEHEFQLTVSEESVEGYYFERALIEFGATAKAHIDDLISYYEKAIEITYGLYATCRAIHDDKGALKCIKMIDDDSAKIHQLREELEVC